MGSDPTKSGKSVHIPGLPGYNEHLVWVIWTLMSIIPWVAKVRNRRVKTRIKKESKREA